MNPEHTKTALAIQTLFAAETIIVDDSPLWLAWQTAQETWLESKRRRSGGENTVRTYARAVERFFSWCSVPPWQISPAHAQEWARWMAGDRDGQGPLAPATVALRLAALSSLYDFVQRRYTFRTPDGRDVALWPADRANPFQAVERPKVSPYGRAVFPTVEEAQTILAAINTKCLTGRRDFALLYTILITCRRSSEVLHLRWGDIQETADGYAFTYRRKGGQTRRAFLHRTCYQAIVAYLQAADRLEDMTEDDYIFVALDPERIRRIDPDADVDPNRPLTNGTVNRILKKYARRAGVDEAKAHVHALRHAGARLRFQQQKEGGAVDLFEIMTLLGHSNVATTQIYTQQVLDDPADPGADAAAAALLPKGKPRRKRTPPAEQAPLL